jgi:FlaA1/EpsC-like NDP-sugar epimerase
MIPDLITLPLYALVTYFIKGLWHNLSFALLVQVCITLLTLASRLTYQWLHLYLKRRSSKYDREDRKTVAIVGAGIVGVMLADELQNNSRSKYRPLCFVDTDPQKIGKYISGLRVYKEEPSIIRRLRQMRVDEIVLALPSMSPEEKKHLFEFYTKTRKKVNVYDFPLNDASSSDGKRRLREFAIEDLLFRDPIKVTSEETNRFYRDKTILVTGGGGSIGSELCRQIARRHPKKLIIFDIYENNVYDIQQELNTQYGVFLDLEVVIGSVRDRERLDFLFANYRPDIVFHAAAHKHVPLMEDSGGEALKNNVLGTYNTADMAEKYGVSKFILISTDKAVNPTNIMGASKRLCEMVVQCRRDSKTDFAAVRFGNVLGSNGSVIPLFRRQIQAGGPITITDKRIIRYFMTIPEASQLVMQAGAMAKHGELFVLDMGKPVKILDLAENMIRLSGLIPYKDIDIKEVGLRPGEKLYEELLIKTETLTKTENKMIFIERDEPLSREEIEQKLSRLREVVNADREIIRQVMRELVPTYFDPSEINSCADASEEMKLACSKETEEEK